MRVWDAKEGKLSLAFKGPKPMVHSAEWSPDGTKIVTACFDGSSEVWNATTGRPLSQMKGLGRSDHASWSPDGTKIAATGFDGGGVWDAASGQSLFRFRTRGFISRIEWNRTSSRFVTAGRHDSIQIWDAESGAELLTLPGSGFASFSPDGTRLLTRRPNGFAMIYDSRSVGRRVTTPSVTRPPPRPAKP